MVGIEQLPAAWRELIPGGILLRSMQLETLLAVASKRDALIIAKTSGGKSRVFQLPAAALHKASLAAGEGGQATDRALRRAVHQSRRAAGGL
mmetsp:Transcript_42644/g.100021  ORF Transcript_42644/g.100021 Transcript_42644/m.100021 type:complete len:92 (-) Transcript_42644:59-334(-)